MNKSLPYLFLLLLAALAVCASPQAFAYGEKMQSVLASGHWVKIKVAEHGIHQITPDELAEWGFDDPSKITIYGYGGTLALDNSFQASTPDDLTQVPSVRTSDGRILFYGVADVDVKMEYNAIGNYFFPTRLRNDYSLHGAYFITDSQDALPMEKALYAEDGSDATVTTHAACAFVEDEAENPFSSRFYFGKAYAPGKTFDVKFPISDYAPEGFDYMRGDTKGTSMYPALYYAYIARSISVQSNLKPKLPAGITERNASYTACAGQMASGGYRFARSTGRTRLVAQDNSAFNNPEFTITFNPSCSQPAKFEYGALDYASIIYPRHNTLADKSEVFMTFMCGSAGQKFEISDASPSIEVWKVVRADKIYAYDFSYSPDLRTATCAFDSTYTLDRQARIIAFDKAKQHRPVEFAGQVATQNLHAISSADFLIITPENYLDAAEELAQIHRDYLGQEVVVATQGQIFNEFSSGTPAVNAYRRFAKMLYDRDKAHFKNILLYGGATSDFRGIARNDADCLLTYQTDRLLEDVRLDPTCYASDAWFGMLESDYNHAALYSQETPVAVGRLPFRTKSQTWKVNEKIRRYVATPPEPDVYPRAVVIADAGDNAVHEEQSNMIKDVLKNASDAFSVALLCKAGMPNENKSEYLKTRLKKELYRGTGFVDYSGHANGAELSANALWSSALADATPYRVPTIFMFSTCSAFQMPSSFASIAEACALAPEGGSIASIGASVSVYLEYNILYNLAVTKAYATAPHGSTIGDMMRAARRIMLDDKTITVAQYLNTIAFNLAGDPALPLPVAPDKVEITDVGGVPTSADDIVLQPATKAAISGRILAADGTFRPDFNGKVNITIYEAPVETNSQEYDHYGNAQPVTLDYTVLSTESADVADGVFTAEIAVPVTDRPDIRNRVTFVAAPSDNSPAAMGVLSNVVVADFDAEKADFGSGTPEISEFYVNGPEMASGDVLAAATSVHAVFSAENGLNVAENQVGFTPSLTLDGKRSFPDINSYLSPLSSDGISSMCLDMPLQGINPGHHTLVLSVADNAGQRARRSVNFVVADASLQGSITAERNPARDAADFSVSLPDQEIAEGRLVITNASGAHIASPSFSGNEARWDLADDNGNPVPDATYYVYARFRTSSSLTGSTPAITITVIR